MRHRQYRQKSGAGAMLKAFRTLLLPSLRRQEMARRFATFPIITIWERLMFIT